MSNQEQPKYIINHSTLVATINVIKSAAHSIPFSQVEALLAQLGKSQPLDTGAKEGKKKDNKK